VYCASCWFYYKKVFRTYSVDQGIYRSYEIWAFKITWSREISRTQSHVTYIGSNGPSFPMKGLQERSNA